MDQQEAGARPGLQGSWELAPGAAGPDVCSCFTTPSPHTSRLLAPIHHFLPVPPSLTWARPTYGPCQSSPSPPPLSPVEPGAAPPGKPAGIDIRCVGKLPCTDSCLLMIALIFFFLSTFETKDKTSCFLRGKKQNMKRIFHITRCPPKPKPIK